jgi:hypothetical protein
LKAGALAPSARADREAAFRFELVAAAGFNVLRASSCGALICLIFEFLLDLAADDAFDFETGRLADGLDALRLVFGADVLSDFLRVFLDIRLPFVAFRGSIIGVLRQTGSIAGQVGLAPDYAQKDFDAPPVAGVAFSRIMNGGAGRSAPNIKHLHRHFYGYGNRRTICKYGV